MDTRAPPFRPDVWLVAFVPAPAMARLAWWQRPLAAGFKHCFAFRAAGQDFTELVDHTGRFLNLTVLPCAADDFAAQLLAEGMTVHIVAPMPAAAQAILRGPMTCVEVVKAVLGIGAPWIITPRQLAAHLERRGAQRIHHIGKEPAAWAA
jgi:hypothetical protein